MSASPAASRSPVALPPVPSAAASPSVVASVGDPPEVSFVAIAYDSVSSPSLFITIVAAQKIEQKYGVTFNTQFASGTNGIAALLSNNLQFEQSSGVAGVEAFAQGAPLRLLGCFQNFNTYAIYGRSGITTPQDLQGRTIACAGHGSNPDISLRAALAPYGLVEDQDFTVLSVGNDPARLAAAVNGNTDAAILDQGGFGQQALDSGLNLIISMHDEKLAWAGSCPTTSAAFVQQNPNTCFAVLKALIDGVRFIQDPSNEAACLPTIAQVMSTTPDDPQVAAYYTNLAGELDVFDPTPGVTTIINALKQANPSQYGSMTPEQVVDSSFLQRLVAAGFVTLSS